MSSNGNNNDIDDRLIRCFTAVFPDLSREQVVSASRDSIAGWDSLSGVTLVSVVEDEFGLDLDGALLDGTECIFTSIRSRVSANCN